MEKSAALTGDAGLAVTSRCYSEVFTITMNDATAIAAPSFHSLNADRNCRTQDYLSRRSIGTTAGDEPAWMRPRRSKP